MRLFIFLSMFIILHAARANADVECPVGPPMKQDEVLIGWLTDVRETSDMRSDKTTRVGPFRRLVLLSGGTIRETVGASIRDGQQFWRAVTADAKQVELRNSASFLDKMGEDHCVYFADVTGPSLPKWTLLASRPLSGVFSKPTKKERAVYAAMNKTCAYQGDYDDGESPPCVRPTVLAVSDINRDGKPEFWATEPYKWDTGLTVWEAGAKLPMLEICTGCSD